MSARAKNPFKAGVVLGMLVLGSAAFLLLLYALGAGWNGQNERDGKAHVRSDALNGYSGLVTLAEANGFYTELGYGQERFDEYPLLVLTPQHYANPEELDDLIEQRRYAGPTMIILPKWIVRPVPELADVEHEPGWVMLSGAMSPPWFEQLEFVNSLKLVNGETQGWSGFGYDGDLPDEENVQGISKIERSWITPLVVDYEGDILAVQLEHLYDDDAWPVTFVLEPDLVNNYGLADEDRARIAMALLEEASWAESEIIFDLSQAGLGKSTNLLTLAFSPPFLAATLCLLLAFLVIGWRGFRRFGPPVLSAPAYAQGKKALASNGAALIARVRRWHLLAEPYADLVTGRVARALGIRSPDRKVQIAAIDSALERAGHQGKSFGETAHDLREASHPREILRGAKLLRDMERTLKR